MYLAILDYLDRVFACIRPRKLLYMAIDGLCCVVSLSLPTAWLKTADALYRPCVGVPQGWHRGPR